MHTIPNAPAQGRWRRRSQREPSGIELRLSNLPQRPMSLAKVLAGICLHVVMKMIFKCKAQSIFLPDLRHCASNPVHIHRGGSVVMLFHPMRDIAAHEALTAREDLFQPVFRPGTEVCAKCIRRTVEI